MLPVEHVPSQRPWADDQATADMPNFQIPSFQDPCTMIAVDDPAGNIFSLKL